MTSKQLKVTLSRQGLEKKTWSVFKPLEIKASATNIVQHTQQIQIQPNVVPNVVPAKTAGCGCGAKKPINGASINVHPPTVISNHNVNLHRLAGAGVVFNSPTPSVKLVSSVPTLGGLSVSSIAPVSTLTHEEKIVMQNVNF